MNLFCLVCNRFYIVDSSGKLMYGEYEFYDHDEAVMALARLVEVNPDKEYEVIQGGIPADEYDD